MTGRKGGVLPNLRTGDGGGGGVGRRGRIAQF